ncbi:MAG: wax ester/triacylglycerol synthase family O-acyltransferase [Cytophagales bacterium]|nr:wax ester/triacylglycerol synthase family O-acyltransferase [Rhizobacter sp.]
MGVVDTAWLRTDNDVNQMVILGIWMLRPGISHAVLCQRLSDKLLKYKRFRQRTVQSALSTDWEFDPEFDIRRHLVVEKLKRRRGQTHREALQQRASELASAPFDHAHPLWQFHLIEHCGDGSALLCRVHHCIGDGVALSMVMMSITDDGPTPPDDLQAPNTEQVSWFSVATLQSVAGWGAKSLAQLQHPQQLLSDTAGLLKKGQQVLGDAAALALMSNDSPTRLKGRSAGPKRVAWCEPMPLERVKAVGHALGCSVNDVLVSCVAGAIGRYLREQGDDPTGQDIRAMVPVNLRAPLDQPPWELGNRFGLAPLLMPIGIDNPLERVYEVRKRMGDLKDNYQPLLAYGVLALAGLLIKPGQDALMRLFQDKTTAIVTNVRGPDTPLRLCGAEVHEVIFWVPTAGNIGLGVSIMSYAGSVQFGLRTDEALCDRPQAVIDQFTAEFEKLTLLTLMLPWVAQHGKGKNPRS